MNNPSIINLVYIIASVLFVLGIKMLGSAKTARKGNLISSVGMLLAIVSPCSTRVSTINGSLPDWPSAGLSARWPPSVSR
jgi:NAD/NADP transhydrogenase beta subunit